MEQLSEKFDLIKSLSLKIEGRKYLKVFDPFSDELIAEVLQSQDDEIKSTILDSHKAFRSWSKETAFVRSEILLNWHNEIKQSTDSLARLMVREQGKPFEEAKAEILYGASFIKWYSEEAKRVNGEILPSPYPERKFLVKKEPVGVVFTITPWNFPFAMFARKASAALAAGCTVITKPAEDTPLTTLAAISLALKAGIKKNILKFIICDRGRVDKICQELCLDDRVKKISFTGSTNVGKRLLSSGASKVKKFSLELGGNAPFIIREDADLSFACEQLILCKFRNAGQTCVSANRIFVHEKIFSAFLKVFLAQTSKLKVGNGSDANVSVGPVINPKALERLKGFIRDLLSNGARILLGSKEIYGENNLVSPIIIECDNDFVKAFNEEIFGPVAVLYKFKSDKEVISRANATEYGLASYLFTKDAKAIEYFCDDLEFGIVCVNSGTFSNPIAPFGGVKASGIGREGGSYGIDEFLETKFCSIKL
tara:strand:- start:34219 stop:35664 length:1446 start_codon:yes stop_codon:yes gene_type:complete